MKFDKTRLANAFALAATIFWVLCTLIVWVIPDFSLVVATWWLHGFDLSIMGSWDLNLVNVLLGGVTVIASAWGAGWILGWSWEQVSKK